MEKSIVAGAIIVVIAIVIVAAVALTYHPAPSNVTTSTTTVPSGSGGNNTGLTNNGGGILAPGCTSSSELGCANATITTSGELSVALIPKVNVTMYDVHVACMAYNTTTNRPVNGSSWYALSNLGTPKQSNYTGTTIQPGGEENVASLQCYTASGMTASLAAGQEL